MSGQVKKVSKGGKVSYISKLKDKKQPTKVFTDKRKVSRSFSKRKDTLLEKAKDLYTATSAEVSVTIRSSSGATYEYRSPNFNELPTCTSETKDSQPSTSSAAPADVEHHSVRESAAQTTESVLSPEVAEDKCRICGEKEGENRMWIGCEVKDCNFWRHAWCMGVTAYRDRALKNLKFYCPKHIGKKQ